MRSSSTVSTRPRRRPSPSSSTSRRWSRRCTAPRSCASCWLAPTTTPRSSSRSETVVRAILVDDPDEPYANLLLGRTLQRRGLRAEATPLPGHGRAARWVCRNRPAPRGRGLGGRLVTDYGHEVEFGLFADSRGRLARRRPGARPGGRGERPGPGHDPGPPVPGRAPRRLDAPVGHRRTDVDGAGGAQRREPAVAQPRRARRFGRQPGPAHRRPGGARSGHRCLLAGDRGRRGASAHPR